MQSKTIPNNTLGSYAGKTISVNFMEPDQAPYHPSEQPVILSGADAGGAVVRSMETLDQFFIPIHQIRSIKI